MEAPPRSQESVTPSACRHASSSRPTDQRHSWLVGFYCFIGSVLDGGSMLLLRGGGKGQPGSQDIPTIKQAGSNLVRAGREAAVGPAVPFALHWHWGD